MIFLSSADWMGRNLDRRVELLFPIEDRDIFQKLKNILSLYLKDNTKASILNKNGNYVKVQKRGKNSVNTQHDFYVDSVNQVQMIASEKNIVKDLI